MLTVGRLSKRNGVTPRAVAGKIFASRLWQWALLALGLHLVWEIGQLPLYTVWQETSAWRMTLYVAHCTLGDGLVATLAYLAVALAWRQPDWPWQRPWTGGAMLVALGLGYTVFSEWYNVYRLASWGYEDAMPRILGIGLMPLLQWLIVPIVMLVLIRRTRVGRRWRNMPSTLLSIFF